MLQHEVRLGRSSFGGDGVADICVAGIFQVVGVVSCVLLLDGVDDKLVVQHATALHSLGISWW